MKILGLDLGSGSIGWAVIEYGFAPSELNLLGLGVRSIPIDEGSLSVFNSGNGFTANGARTAKRTARKILDRFQARKKTLIKTLADLGIEISDELMHLPKLEVWGLRARAAQEKISLPELARVLLFISQKRGYNASKADLDSNNLKSDSYKGVIMRRYEELKSEGLTIGQYYYKHLSENPNFRVREKTLPRQAYREEFDAIMAKQAQFYPDVLTDDVIHRIGDLILFYQRPLRSCKHLVSNCEFMSYKIEKDGKSIVIGPKVASKSNPLFQVSRIWQAVNNIELTNRKNPKEPPYVLSLEQKKELVKHLFENPALKVTDLYAHLFNKKKSVEWAAPENVGKGIPGFKFLIDLKKILDKKYAHLTKFDLEIDELIDPESGEVVVAKISDDVINQPLYKLWHTLYSISNIADCKNALQKNFGIEEEEILDALSSIDFSTYGYGSMSEKAIKRILPYLLQGEKYSDACAKAGFKHSDSLTVEENAMRPLADKLQLLKKGELRQPVVEKILNQMVKLVNLLMEKYGQFDEIHIELARELKLSKEKRIETTRKINEREQKNKKLAELIVKKYGFTPTPLRILKLKLFEESEGLCMYCQSKVSPEEFLSGRDVEIEHIVPKALLFDDSFANKVCACRDCNQKKKKMTAYDFMKEKLKDEFASYVERVTKMAEKGKISKEKLNRLLMSESEIPNDFIDRQLRESQYIAKKAMEMLREVCRVVVPTTGSVTVCLRRIWRWDRVLHDLNLPRYSMEEDLVEVTEEHKKPRIKNWNKRCDHRHHAIDALTIACTTRSVIQRLNTLNTLQDDTFLPFLSDNDEIKERQSKLEHFVNSLPHFSYAQVFDAVAGILVSFKSGVKFVSKSKRYTYSGGKRKLVQEGILTPRGPLHGDHVYGRILRYDKNGKLVPKVVRRYSLSSIGSEAAANSIVDAHIRRLVIDRIKSTTAKQNTFAEPLYSDAAHTQQIRTVRRFTIHNAVIPIGGMGSLVMSGDNHHVAVYADEKGKLKEHVATFFHCVERKKAGIPAIITDPSATWSQILNSKESYDQEFLELLPKDGLSFRFSMQRNEMFILGMSLEEVKSAIESTDYKLLNQCLYKVLNLSSMFYCFALHTVTKGEQKEYNKNDKRLIRIQSMQKLKEYNPIKVEVSQLGEISLRK